MLALANISNGLIFHHDDVCFFQSTHGHHAKMGYFRLDAMPWSAVIYLMLGGEVTIVDATQHSKSMTDAQKFGVPTWCMVYNRAIRIKAERVCDWQTPAMIRVASSNIHKKLIHSIRKLAKYYNPTRPAVINQNVYFVCHRNFKYDDKIEVAWRLMYGKSPLRPGRQCLAPSVWV